MSQMKQLNKVLRILFIVSAIAFLYMWSVTPKTDCQACKFDYEGETINGYEAYEIYVDACFENVKYENYLEKIPLYINLSDVEITYEDGLTKVSRK